jgi:hypothetical protein
MWIPAGGGEGEESRRARKMSIRSLMIRGILCYE